MPFEEMKPTEVRIDGLKVEQFLKEDFLNIIKKEFNGITVQHFCLYITETEEDSDDIKLIERISVAHDEPEDERNSKINIGAKSPETIKIFLKILSDYFNK